MILLFWIEERSNSILNILHAEQHWHLILILGSVILKVICQWWVYIAHKHFSSLITICFGMLSLLFVKLLRLVVNPGLCSRVLWLEWTPMSQLSEVLQGDGCWEKTQRTYSDERIRLIWFKNFFHMMKAFLYKVVTFCLYILLGTLFSTNSGLIHIIFPFYFLDLFCPHLSSQLLLSLSHLIYHVLLTCKRASGIRPFNLRDRNMRRQESNTSFTWQGSRAMFSIDSAC